MTNDEFKSTLTEFKYYLKPALFTVLTENADVFSDKTKKEIIDKLLDADKQMGKLYDYQDKRNGIMQQGLQKMDEIYQKVKARFKAEGKADQLKEAAQADQLISNL